MVYNILGYNPKNYTTIRLFTLEQITLKEADRNMKNFQTSMDILREDAREEERERIVMKMIRSDVNVDTISQISRLDPQRILELRSKIIR